MKTHHRFRWDIYWFIVAAMGLFSSVGFPRALAGVVVLAVLGKFGQCLVEGRDIPTGRRRSP